VAHWYRQLGLAQDVVQEDLRRLSKEEAGTRDIASTTWLADFRASYPALFDALKATFYLLPSTTRLMESTHSSVRQMYHGNHTWAYIDAWQTYMSSEGYRHREARRRKIREAMGGSNKSVKHEDRKETAQMAGQQLLESMSRYTFRVAPRRLFHRRAV